MINSQQNPLDGVRPMRPDLPIFDAIYEALLPATAILTLAAIACIVIAVIARASDTIRSKFVILALVSFGLALATGVLTVMFSDWFWK